MHVVHACSLIRLLAATRVTPKSPFPTLRLGHKIGQKSSPFGQMQLGIQWTLTDPNSLGPEPIQISEIFRLVKFSD